MMPGLHPGLLIRAANVRLPSAPQFLWIDTSGGDGNRVLGMALTLEGGVAPYTYDWSLEITGIWTPIPAFGSGTVGSGYLSFSSNVYHSGGEWSLTEVGRAIVNITAANGASGGLNIPIYAGGAIGHP